MNYGQLVARAGRAFVRYYKDASTFLVYEPDPDDPDRGGQPLNCFFSLFWALAALHQLAPNEVIELYEGEWI